MEKFNPGALVEARERIWIVQPGSDQEVLRLRPIDGSEDENTAILLDIEPKRPRAAVFDWPDPAKHGPDLTGTMLLKDALTLKMRNGAGAFRSFGSIAVEPKAYQLVPLLMALRQDIIRLLIADDVGVGKTIEAGLILRELIDRGEVTQAAVLCPPHLCDQWRSELKERFHIDAKVLTPRTVKSLEKNVPAGTLYNFYKYMIVSLDYIKSDEHRQNFIVSAPDFIIVDEAHTCTTTGTGKQQRYQLLKELSKKEERNMLLLTATPHSGNEKGFYNLLSILDPKYLRLSEVNEKTPEASRLREELGNQLVQRRRKDIAEWRDSDVFPRRLQSEITYKLTGEWGTFFDGVQNYCIGLAEKYESDKDNPLAKTVIWYATLGLLRCAASSPAAAVSALSTRLERITNESGILEDLESSDEFDSVFDRDNDAYSTSDIEPAVGDDTIPKLKALINTAMKLGSSANDPKINALIIHMKELLGKGARPVVFCRYIATAKYVAEELKAAFENYQITAVTGEQPPDERMERVDESASYDKRILVATDCLSEGINLQDHYDAAVHYDLSWNPTRHEQREGRIDRFGQMTPNVYCSLIYGEDNPVDGFILRVILKKTKTIRDELGIYIQSPEEKEKIEGALIKAALMRRKNNSDRNRQTFLFEEVEENEIKAAEETIWKDALAAAKRNRTIFAQNRIHPEKVIAQLEKQNEYLGTDAQVEEFVCGICERLGVPPQRLKTKALRFSMASLPDKYKGRLEAAGISMKPFDAGFSYPAKDAVFIHRSHPLVSTLGDILLESVLARNSVELGSRSSATPVRGIDAIYSIFLLRLRHKLAYSNTSRSENERNIVAEETVFIGMKGLTDPEFFTDKIRISGLLALKPAGNLANTAVAMQIEKAEDSFRKNSHILDKLARERADALLKEHKEIRDSARLGGSWKVEACLPVDVMGVSVLIPAL